MEKKMMMKTHVLMASAIALAILPFVNYKLVFFPLVLIATLLPDVDIANSYMGRRWYFRPIQWFTKHRGFIHSFTFCVLVSIILAFYLPIAALPFFLGYTIHLFGDSLTVEGIRPLWPHKKEISGRISVNGVTEKGFFFFCVGANILFLILLFI